MYVVLSTVSTLWTSIFVLGESVPTPTVPSASIRILSILFVPNVTFPFSLLLIVKLSPFETRAVPSVASAPVVSFVNFNSEEVVALIWSPVPPLWSAGVVIPIPTFPENEAVVPTSAPVRVPPDKGR